MRSIASHPPRPTELEYFPSALVEMEQVLMPLMMAAYTLQYIDKSAMSYAAIFTFRAGERASLVLSRYTGDVMLTHSLARPG